MWEVTVERTAADEEVLLVRRWRRAQFMRLERVKAPMNVGERLIDGAKPRLDAGEAILH